MKILITGTIGDEGSQPKSGVLVSPNYPNDYLPRQQDGYLEERIQVTKGKVIKLHFSNFATEVQIDVLTIMDIFGDNISVLGSFSGSAIPDDIVSQSNVVDISFQPDTSVQKSGWRLEWTEVDPPA